jgi:lambda family phage minor tail protein L
MTTVPQTIQEQIQSLAPSAVIELYQLHMTQAVNGGDVSYYFHAGTNELYGNIVFDGITYAATPVEFDGFKRSSTGTLPRPKFTVANTDSAISSLLISYNPLNAQVKRVRTCKKFLDAENFTSGTNPTADSTAVFEADDTWFIDRVASENPTSVQFDLTTKLDLTNVRLPKRQVLEHCPWLYKGTQCGYAGTNYFNVNDGPTSAANDKCGHRYSSCALRFPTGDLPFGGFPGARLQM